MHAFLRAVHNRRRLALAAGAAAVAVVVAGPAGTAAAHGRDGGWPGESHSSGSTQDVGWRYYGNDLANTRYQNVDQISTANVGALKPAWVFHTGVLDPKASLEVSPIVIGSTMYVSDGHDDVFALDATTGKVRWSYRPALPPPSKVAVCCGRDNRGVAYGDGLIFVATLDARLIALDARTGRVRWQATVADWHHGYSMTMAPQFVDNEVIVGVSGGEYEIRGAVAAYDARNGRPIWGFGTTRPGPTWAGSSWRTGGAPVWGNPTVDRALGLVYVGTGNAAPDFYGQDRAGLNLYASSVVALDVRTGRMRWAFQETHHDLWDYDGPQPPILFTLDKDGRAYPALAHCNKNANLFILDRRTGRPLYPVTEQPVPTTPGWQHPWPTQPKSSVTPVIVQHVLSTPPGMTSVPEYTPPSQTPALMQPGSQAGCEWAPGAYSPRTGYIYTHARYQPVILTSHPGNTGTPGNTSKDEGSNEVPHVNGVQYFGQFDAIDTATGKMAWTIRVPQLALSGVTVAGNLVFFGQENGQFDAANARTGRVLWSFDGTSVRNGGGSTSAPAAYVVNGREYIVDAFGGNAPDRQERKQTDPNGDAIVAFALPTATSSHEGHGGPGRHDHDGAPSSRHVPGLAAEPARSFQAALR